MSPFDASLGLRRVGADDVDVELPQSPAELGVFVSARRMVDAEDARSIAVEGNRLPMAIQVGASGFKVRERRLGLHEAQLLQAARRIVHEDQQCADRTSVLEPGVLASVDLDQLPETLSSPPRLMGWSLSQRTWHPQSVLGHPLAQGLDRDAEVVQLLEFLLSQRRSEVCVALTNQGHGSPAKGLWELPITGPTTLLRDQPSSPVLEHGAAQTLDLALAQTQQGGRLALRQTTFEDPLDDVQPIELGLDHGQEPRAHAVETGASRARLRAETTFLLFCSNTTFACGAYTQSPIIPRSVECEARILGRAACLEQEGEGQH